ncbi:hypothetical protein TNCV_2483691 [Trichonephila clavipes]|uniref:Uncharacterized protein n=1 Tax=Trichonephila clavipes TaxID=2585209 RepID=A0A8X7BAZ9_TRICX|nr:hypothetical protein TNCV_2483691 [Trichonephila clavipes]
MDVCSPIFKFPGPFSNFAITHCFSAISFCYVAIKVSNRHVSRNQKTDNRPFLTLGGRFNHLKHFKGAQQSFHGCYRAGEGGGMPKGIELTREGLRATNRSLGKQPLPRQDFIEKKIKVYIL